MKKIVLGLMCLIISCNSSQKMASESSSQQEIKPETNSTEFAETITEAELKEHLYVYASDEFEGRETGSEGQKKAIEYIKSAYEKLGIPAAQSDGNYFQNVPLEIKKTPNGVVTLNDKNYNLGEHILSFSPLTGSHESVVYVGFGIEDENYSSYENVDVKGKYIIVKAGEPIKNDSTYIITGSREKSIWSDVSEALGKKMQLAKDKGSKGVLYLDQNNFPRFKNRYNYLKAADNNNMNIKSKNGTEFVSFFIDEEFATAVKSDILEEDSSEIISITLKFDLSSTNSTINSENVAAILKGSEKPNEYVVISSHLDHIGINSDGEINNGADDDGSGTVALLEIAEAFKKAADKGKGPKRSIVFLHVTGEEKGLLGSQYYTDVDPIVPLTNTVANLNIDMIGRIDPKREGDRNYIYLIGSDKLSTDLHELSEEVNEKYMNIELDYTYNDENDPNRFYYRSDHYNFAKNNIPIIFYFNGTHADYHRPTDTPDKINYDLLQNRSRLIFYTAWEVANRDLRVVVDKSSK